MMLPFGSLSWENFERLCYRLALKQGVFDHVARYGRQGQAQQGIDIYARTPDGRYSVWQAKRYANYSPHNLKSAIETFLNGSWVDQTDTFVIAVQASLEDVKLQDEIERQVKRLADMKITLEVLGGDTLVERIRPYKELVSDFFGRAWLEAFYGFDLESDFKSRLDGIEFAKVRTQLERMYATRFSFLDQGIVGTQFETTPGPQRSLALLERFAMTDVFVRDRAAETRVRQPQTQIVDTASRELRPNADRESHGTVRMDEIRRLSAADWLSDGDQLAVIADAGSGKSTLLRAIALDLLGNQSVFASLGQRWGDRLPLVIPFAKWAKATKLQDGEVGLKEVVAQTLQPLLTGDIVSLVDRAVEERRIILLIDGLDEWSSEQAARTALHTLLTYVQVHEIPTLVSGRPNGLRKIGALPQSWKTAELAPLSHSQQSYLANIWFRHLQPKDPSGDSVRELDAAWRAERFLKELRAEAALEDLAGTPLLFIGLLFLSLRNMALPHNRAQALRALVTLLIESHPEARATAAGEGRPRFENAATPEVRHLALGALAYASRRDGGDAGYNRAEASSAIVKVLVGRGHEISTAQEVATELLAVNAETVGLLVEKGPEDVGFVHASLEEYLCAVHIQSWRFKDLIGFVSENAGNSRWRNVLRNLVSINVRPDEIDEIVEALEKSDLDVTGDINRRQLLAEIAFSSSAISSQTAARLAEKTFETIEGFGLASERAAMVRVCINGLSNPILRPAVEFRLRRWMPRRVAYTSQIYEAIATWPRSEEQLTTLIKGLGDEDRYGARTAARCLAEVYNDDPDVSARLFDLVSPQTDLTVVAGAIQALVLGWPQTNLAPTIDDLATSRSLLLEATAIWARVKLGLHSDTDRDRCLQLVDDRSALEYYDSDIVTEALLTGWKNDDVLVEEALSALGDRGVRSGMSRTVAMTVLLMSEPGRPAVREWLLEELEQDYPLNTMSRSLWSNLIGFANQDSAIKEAVVSKIISDDLNFLDNDVWPLIAELGDERLRDHAIGRVRSNEGFGRYWSLLPLLKGWADDTKVVELVQEMIALPDGDLGMIAAFIPNLYDDPGEARARLIRILREQPEARADLIFKAIIELGSDDTDEDTVKAILPWLNADNSFAEPLMAYISFSTHPAVREQALLRMEQSEPPFDILARAFPDEPRIREAALSAASAIPRELRAVVVASAGISGDRHPALFSVLESYGVETDYLFGVQLSVDYHQLRQARGDVDGLVEHLVDELDRPGPRFEENRTTAFAGLVVLNEPQAVLKSTHRTGKVRIRSYFGEGVSSALGTLIVRKWDMLKSKLGSDFVNAVLTDDRSVWGDISRFAGPYPDVRRDFFDWCMSEENIGVTALRTLAELWPRSGVLLEHVLRILTHKVRRGSYALPIIIAAAEILRDQFYSPEYVAELRNLFKETPEVGPAVALAILDPTCPDLHRSRIPTLEFGVNHGNWLGAAQIASRLDPPDVFVAIVHAVADRAVQMGSSSQALITEVLVERVVHDSEARERLRASLNGEVSPDGLVAVVSILARAGYLDGELLDMCAVKLSAEQARNGIPIAVFDINRDTIRPYSHVLMEFFQPGGTG
ncbi:NACHT domain-containing protein [Ruegeria sp. R13_0]|uniref:NACHT domain-containing protein n=1 Tax=Ruegeria sp. R13_0 TaxID=2821099 RepID=UPI001ADBA6E0|nr:NACHT domain-containing protein [Ruegeria sp. R13_0]MBO9436998.1 NACHT domain-containing protein [Ruegeria sp. R13_0]